MIVGFIGDIVGKPGRLMVKEYLPKIREDYGLDVVIANGENASHGFGLSKKNADELFGYGIDYITGGNHIWDKKDIIPLLDTLPIIRPLNYPQTAPGKGYEVFEREGEKLGIVNIMGYFTMPMVSNPFLSAQDIVQKLKDEGIKNIFIDFHAEATSEKRALYLLVKKDISALCGTHTHIGTDDLTIEDGTLYLSDIGLSGCRDAVIGMDKEAPIKRFTTGLSASYDIPKKCKRIMQIVVFELKDSKCINAKKIKVYDDKDELVVTEAFKER